MHAWDLAGDLVQLVSLGEVQQAMHSLEQVRHLSLWVRHAQALQTGQLGDVKHYLTEVDLLRFLFLA